MAVDFMGYTSRSSGENFSSKLEETAAVQEAASGLESVEKLIRLLSNRHVDIEAMDCNAVADVAVTKFKRVISLLGRTRTGHARFRRAPLQAQAQVDTKSKPRPTPTDHSRVYCAMPIQQIPPPPPPPPPPPKDSSSTTTINFSSYSSAATAATASFVSSLTGDTESKQQPQQEQPSLSSPGFQITKLSSAGKPPLSSTTTTSLKRKCSSENLGSGQCASGSSGRCHCSKKRKLRLKRVVRVPAISLKMADIPPDDYSWRKYGQKPIKGSPYPRGYYKCSSVRGCPARKHVERALDDPSMLVVTYEGEHNHSLSVAEASNLILESS